MDNIKYVYLLKNPENGKIFRYVVAWHMMAMSVKELFDLMKRGMLIASPYRFQIGVKIIKDNKETIHWHNTIYTMGTVKDNVIYNLKNVPYNLTENDIVISPAFSIVFNKKAGNFLTIKQH